MTGKPGFEVVKTTMGLTSIKDLKTGEILHNPVGPWAEANDLYVAGTRLKERLRSGSGNTGSVEKPLVLFDVGLGAGFNAVAAIEALREVQGTGPARPLHIVSFERRPELFEFSLAESQAFPFMERHRSILDIFLKTGRIVDENGLSWELRLGPFEELVQKEKLFPEIVFFDPYSPKTNPEMWEFAVVQRLFDLARRAGGSADGSERGSVLATYSMSTAVRVTLLLAGFFVGAGPRSGAKSETTIAATALNELAEPPRLVESLLLVE